jgi:hypothetical protein
MIARRTPMLVVFTAGLEEQHNYSTQLFDAFPELDFGDRLRLEWFSDSGHTFAAEPQRKRMIELAVSWAQGLGAQAAKLAAGSSATGHAVLCLIASATVPVAFAAALLEAL